MAPELWPEQLTISKHGEVKIGATRLHHLDLNPIQACIWAEVNRLQWLFITVPLWLVGETVHVWLNQSTHNFHWSDTDNIEAFLHEYREPDYPL